MRIQPITFKGKPNNYSKVDKYVSRSAQPQKEDFEWLKKHGVTDVINFRTMIEPSVDFDEKEVVEKLGMKYHSIPTVTFAPNETKIDSFMSLVDEISQNGGKAHIHCKAGADRTGMYTFIYKSMKQIGDMVQNETEWINKGHNTKLYPNLIPWTENFLKKKVK